MINQSSPPVQLPLAYAFSDWCYWSETQGQFVPLPQWATYLMSVGKVLEELPPYRLPTLTALSLPTARFAAALTTSGYLLGSDESITLEQHIQTLRTLPVGRQVWVNTTSKRIRGTFQGIVQASGGELIRTFVKQGRNSHYHSVPLSSALQIQVASDNTPAKRSRHIEKVRKTPFAAAALRSANNPRPWMQSNIEAIIVGQKNRLLEEVTKLLFAIDSGGSRVSGSLQEVIRVREFSDRGDPIGFATIVETPRDQRPPEIENPGVVIFDGPRAFLNARTRYAKTGNWIVILDRTSRGFPDAVMAIDDLYIERAEDIPLGILPDPPAGIEITSFRMSGGEG